MNHDGTACFYNDGTACFYNANIINSTLIRVQNIHLICSIEIASNYNYDLNLCTHLLDRLP